ncbi:MAG: sigma-70 family RNA polymerase sigma factor [Planctomycetota bacterium]
MPETLTPESVPAVLRRARAGDDSAWAELLDAYGRRVFGLLLSKCGDRELAEELTQRTFVKLVETIRAEDEPSGRGAAYEERGRFEAWLFRVAVNALRDEMRRRKRQAKPTDMSPAASSGSAEQASGWAEQQTRVVSGVAGVSTPAEAPLDAMQHAEQVEHLRRCVAALPEADREVLELRHTAGLSFAQIAETLDQPLGTVLARGHRAVKKLRAMMQPSEAAP